MKETSDKEVSDISKKEIERLNNVLYSKEPQTPSLDKIHKKVIKWAKESVEKELKPEAKNHG